MSTVAEAASLFLDAASVPRDALHSTGSLEEAGAVLAAHPGAASFSVHTAAALGDTERVRAFLAASPACATEKAPPRNWDALTYLCFSRYLRLDPTRSEGFEACARALLEAGADARTGWIEPDHQPEPEWESALYGAAGVAHHAGVTALLLAHGADPNDQEVTYHTPESYDNGALKALVATEALTPDSLAVMLVRKADWHDAAGAAYLLAHGADPNRMTIWGWTALHQAIRRGNDLPAIEAMLNHGGNPDVMSEGGLSGAVLAAREGRGDVIRAMKARGIWPKLSGVDGLIAACALGDSSGASALASAHPDLAAEARAAGGALLARFAGNGNVDGVGCLLRLGVDVAARFEQGDPYFDIAPGSQALHVAAWRMRPAVVEALLRHGAPVNEPDGAGRSALALAVKACVDSHWMARRTPDCVRLLLDAGASPSSAPYPSGYAEADSLLAARLNSG